MSIAGFRFAPRPAAQLDAVLKRLEAVAIAFSNMPGKYAGSSAEVVGAYIREVADQERLLSNEFLDLSDDAFGLHTRRFWALVSMDPTASATNYQTIAEIEFQIRRLREAATDWRAAAQQFNGSQVLVAPDTNTIVRGQWLTDVRWNELVGAARATLVLPHVVLDELDRLSYRSSTDTSERARKALRYLRENVDLTAPSNPVPLRADVMLQLYVDPPGHAAIPNADGEFLDRVELLRMISGVPVHVATRDYGMQLRAAARRLRAVHVIDSDEARPVGS
jgi:hypothetical protein